MNDKILPWLVTDYQQFAERAQAGKLHHALLLQGSVGVGKRQLADALAAYLLCHHTHAHHACGQCQSCTLLTTQAQPDLHVIESDKQIGVDAIRGAIEKLQDKAHLSHNKVLIMPNAESMTEAAANALLKTLEEPQPKTFLLLLSAEPQRLLPTILSRCEKHKLTPPSAQVCQEWLVSQGQKNVPVELLSLHNFAPLAVLQELNEQAESNTLSYQEFVNTMEVISPDTVAVLADKWQADASKIVRWLALWCKTRWFEQPQKAWQCYQSCLQAQTQLINPGINRMLLLGKLLNTCVFEEKHVC